MATHNEAKIWFVCAASGMGKGVWVKDQLKRLNPLRLAIWDPMNEYGAFAPRAQTMKTFVGVLAKAGKGPVRVRFVPPQRNNKQLAAQFAVFCDACMAAGNLVEVVEEASLITTASYAPGPWKRNVNMGRHQGIHLIVISQYPAQVDTGVRGSATLFHTGHLGNSNHRKAVAVEMDIHPDDIRGLEKFQWIEKDMSTKAITRGQCVPPGAPTPTGSSGSPTDSPAPVQPEKGPLDL